MRQIHVQNLRQQEQRQNENNTLGDSCGACGLDHNDDRIDHKRDQQNVDDVHDFYCRQHRDGVFEKINNCTHKQYSAYT